MRMKLLGGYIYVATNVKSFSIKVRDVLRNKPKELAFNLQKRIALEALRSLVFFTPVDTGKAMGNWRVSLGKSSTATPFKGGKRIGRGGDFEENRSAASAFALSQEKKIIGFKRKGQIIWISNSVPYILKLEGVDGPPISDQAPQGMAGITRLRLKLLFGA